MMTAMFLKQITLHNLLSFKKTAVELGPLNVLIGPNAAGKSNLIEAISLLKAAPSDLRPSIIRGGGVRSWIWLGDPLPSPIASLDCRLAGSPWKSPLRYFLEFSEDAHGFVILRERLETEDEKELYFERTGRHVAFGSSAAVPFAETDNLSASDSVLLQFRSPVDPTPITQVGREFDRIRIFREFRTGPMSQSRIGVSTTVTKDVLNEGGDNLALVLLDLDFRGMHGKIVEYLKRLSDRFEDVKVRVEEGAARTYFQETGLIEPLPAVRASDGTLKFLCLLAVLLDPTPSPLVCIEEPELGLHPEALQIVGQALIEASERTQLIVTTHSEALVDALSAKPDAVLVCEPDFDNSTQFKRLSKPELDSWLETYTLGELWRKGEIGGTRW